MATVIYTKPGCPYCAGAMEDFDARGVAYEEKNVTGGANIEAEALDTSPLVGKPLREIDLPNGLRVGAILRDGEVQIPNGDTEIKAHDRVVMFAMAENVHEVEQMFRVSLEFF